MTTPPATDLITIAQTADGQLATTFYPHRWSGGGVDPVKVGIALASATRVITSAFLSELGLDESHREQIEATICEVYNRDLGWGDDGEKESTRAVEGPQG